MLTLADMLEMQSKLQELYADGDPWTMQSNQHRIDYIKKQYINIVKEISEALDEVGWKDWADSDHINPETGLKELVDVWHMFMNWMLALGGLMFDDREQLAEWFTDHYREKNWTNQLRRTQPQGYNGFTPKCSNCQRETSDGVWEQAEDDAFSEYLVCPCGQVIDARHHKKEEADG